MKNLDPRTRRLLLLVLAVGGLLRLAWLLEVSQAPDFSSPRFESLYHDYWARALLSGDWTPPPGVTDPEIPERPFFRPPGYPYFLALVRAVAGDGWFLPRAVQSLLGLASCLLLFGFARRWFGAPAALGATALMATYWLFMFFETEFMAPSLIIALLLGMVSMAARWGLETPGVRHAACVGVLLGLTALVRPNALALLPVLCGWFLWVRWWLRRESVPWRPMAVLVIVTLGTVLPATLRNLSVAGDPVLITSNAGINLFVGTHPESDGYTPGVPELGELLGLSGWDSFDQPKIVAAVEAVEGRPMRDSDVSSFFSRRAVDTMLEDPLGTLRRLERKALLFWGPAEISNNKVLALEREASSTLRLGLGFPSILALALAGLGLLGWELSRAPGEPARDDPRLAVTALVLLIIGVYAASYLPFFVAARFRTPLIPLLMLFGGVALAGVWHGVVERRWKPMAVGLAVFVGLRVLVGTAWIPYEPDAALWHFRRGLLYQEQKQLGPAVESFRRAIELAPERRERFLPLADSLAAAGLLPEATATYRALLADGSSLDASQRIAGHNNLAMTLAQQGQIPEAVDHWHRVLAIDPNRPSALVNLAGVYATHPELRDPPRAVELAERAAELTGGRDPRVLSVLEMARGSSSVDLQQ